MGAMFFLLPSLASTMLPIRSIVIQGRSRYWSSFKVQFSADFWCLNLLDNSSNIETRIQ